ncbi:ornithine cyclodeaminase [Synergistales bacterium]|nr:ornithine cyclodeaminase [Synergistales bacterium]
MLIISADDIRKTMTMKDAIESNREAFAVQSRGEARLPVRVSFDVQGRGVSSFMPGYVSSLPLAGIKIVSVFGGNAEKNLPVVAASVLLLDPDTGLVSAIIDGTEMTRLRTGAISGLATSLLANEDAALGALFGVGGQAPSQLEGMLAARSLSVVRVFDACRDRIASFIENNAPLAERYGAKLVPAASSDEAVDGADVITTVTTAAEPVFDGRRLKEGAHVNGVGSYIPDRRELDSEVIRRADVIFVDNMDAIMAEAGDILIPIKEGVLKKDKIRGELGDLILGRVKGRASKGEITVMKTVGFATLDIVIAGNIYRKAKTLGIGTNL